MPKDLLSIRRPKCESKAPKFTAFATGFRTFFLSAALASLYPVLVWVLVHGLHVSAGLGWMASTWHGHEMLFGFAFAIVCGFLTTAVPRWTGTPPLAANWIRLLWATWFFARCAMLFAEKLPPALLLGICASIYPLIVIAVARPIFARRHRQNYVFALLLLLFGLANVLVHLPIVSPNLPQSWSSLGLRLALYLLIFMIVVISGRIVPGFTNNALFTPNREPVVLPAPRLDRLCAVTSALALTSTLAVQAQVIAPAVAGFASLLAGTILALRTYRWRLHKTLSHPLLWSLHGGHAFVALGFLLIALHNLGLAVSEITMLHGLAIGGIGISTLAMMTRVALGHTGRALQIPRAMSAAFVVVFLAFVWRVVVPTCWPEYQTLAIVAAALAWALSILIYLRFFARILLTPRPDGQRG
jgi:uncharacterized protein involved in response to NO